jgi:hypothetical protein
MDDESNISSPVGSVAGWFNRAWQAGWHSAGLHKSHEAIVRNRQIQTGNHPAIRAQGFVAGFPPKAQLPVEILQTKSDLAALIGRHQ